MIEDMYRDEVQQQQQSEAATTQNNPTSAGAGAAGGVAVISEQNATMIPASSTVTDGAGDHLFISTYPSSMHMHGSHGGAVVSLTLGLQQQPSFAPPPLMPPHLHHRSSLMLQGEEEEPVVVVPMPYRDRDPMGSQLLHDLDQLVG